MTKLKQWKTAIDGLKVDSYRTPSFSENKIQISQSIISSLFFKNEDKEYCPNYIYEVFVMGKKSIPNEYMIRGLYFEQALIGTASNESYSLPKKLNGGITAAESRINHQIDVFPLVCDKHNIIVLPDKSNCQIEKTAFFKTINGIDIYLRGKADMVSNIKLSDHEEVGVIDLKLTGSLSGPYWGNPSMIDPIQSTVYSVLFELPFYYFVFEYSKELQYKIFNTASEYSSDKSLRQEGKIRRVEMYEKIRKASIIIMELIENPPKEEDKVPNRNNCQLCPLNELNGGNCTKPQKINII